MYSTYYIPIREYILRLTAKASAPSVTSSIFRGVLGIHTQSQIPKVKPQRNKKAQISGRRR